VLAVLLVLAAALTGLVIAAVPRVGAFDCPGIVPLVEDGVVVGQTIYDCVEPTAAWWGLVLGAGVGAAAAVFLLIGLRLRSERTRLYPVGRRAVMHGINTTVEEA
jgi:hypothetical protein